MKILITGGAGFIGYHLTHYLLSDSQNRIVLVDNLQRGQADYDFLQLLAKERVSFLQGDLTDPVFYESLDRGFDHVYHLAAVNGTKWFYEMPAEVLRINILSLFYILEWIRDLEQKPKLCFTSSNEAYASALKAFGQLPIPTPESVPLVVEDVHNPRWTYAGSKLIGEQMVIHYAQTYNFSAVVVRPHNFYGPRAGFDHVIPEWCGRIANREEPFVLYSPDETRSFCYIKDAVEAMQLLMDSTATDSYPVEVVHIGNSKETEIGELLKTLCLVAGWAPGSLDIKSSLKGSVRRRCPDVTKIEGLIGWRANTSLEDGLHHTFEWYNNRKS